MKRVIDKFDIEQNEKVLQNNDTQSFALLGVREP